MYPRTVIVKKPFNDMRRMSSMPAGLADYEGIVKGV